MRHNLVLSLFVFLLALPAFSQSEVEFPHLSEVIFIEPNKDGEIDANKQLLTAALTPFMSAKMLKLDIDGYMSSVVAVKPGQTQNALNAINSLEGFMAVPVLEMLSLPPEKTEIQDLIGGNINGPLNAIKAVDKLFSYITHMAIHAQNPGLSMSQVNEQFSIINAQSQSWNEARAVFRENMNSRRKAAFEQKHLQAEFAMMTIGDHNSILGGAFDDSAETLALVNRMMDAIELELKRQIEYAKLYMSQQAAALIAERKKQFAGRAILEASHLVPGFTQVGLIEKHYMFSDSNNYDSISSFLFQSQTGWREVLRLLSGPDKVARLVKGRLLKIITSYDVEATTVATRIRANEVDLEIYGLAHQFKDSFEGETFDQILGRVREMSQFANPNYPLNSIGLLPMMVQALGYGATFQLFHSLDSRQTSAIRSLEILEQLKTQLKTNTMKKLLAGQQDYVKQHSSLRDKEGSAKLKVLALKFISTPIHFTAPSCEDALKK